MPLPDEAFRVSQEIEFKSALDWPRSTHVYAYGPDYIGDHTAVNIEFIEKSEGKRKMIDAYFYPEDLERLGILFQYLGQTAREKRDGG